jgi:hypothetical protein
MHSRLLSVIAVLALDMREKTLLHREIFSGRFASEPSQAALVSCFGTTFCSMMLTLLSTCT